MNTQEAPQPLTIEEQHAMANPQTWWPYKPEGKDQPHTITGRLVSVDAIWSDKSNGFRIAAVIYDEDRVMWSVRTYPKELHGKWKDLKPQIGETVSVRYTGEKHSERYKRDYPAFSVAVIRNKPVKSFDYAGLNGGGEQDVEAEVPIEPVDDPVAPASSTAQRAEEGDSDIPF